MSFLDENLAKNEGTREKPSKKWKEVVERESRRERKITKAQFDSYTWPCQRALTDLHFSVCLPLKMFSLKQI